MGINFDIGNILKFPQRIKIVELILSFICMIWARFGVNGNIAIFAINTDAIDLGILTCFGYFIISIIQIIGILCDDKQSRVQDVLFALFGFFCYLGFGCKSASDIAHWTHTAISPSSKGLAGFCIFTSFFYLVDSFFLLMKLRSPDSGSYDSV